jgi:hypothetical protein
MTPFSVCANRDAPSGDPDLSESAHTIYHPSPSYRHFHELGGRLPSTAEGFRPASYACVFLLALLVIKLLPFEPAPTHRSGPSACCAAWISVRPADGPHWVRTGSGTAGPRRASGQCRQATTAGRRPQAMHCCDLSRRRSMGPGSSPPPAPSNRLTDQHLPGWARRR